MTKFIKGNNCGQGFYYQMQDGTRGWVHGLSKAEWNQWEREHGKFVYYKRA